MKNKKYEVKNMFHLWHLGCIGGAVGVFFWCVFCCFLFLSVLCGGLVFLSGSGKSFLSKRDRKRLLSLVHSTDWRDEDSVWDCGVELCRFSVLLRAEVLRRGEFDE